MKSLFKICSPLLATALLASCGGGGSDGHGAFEPADSGYIDITALTQQLPLNTNRIPPQLGGPFTSEVTIKVRRRDGALVTEVDSVNVAISPVAVATFSTLDDPETEDINEFLLHLGYAPVDVEAGTATVFVTSNSRSGTALLEVTVDDIGEDEANLSFQSKSIEFVVGNVAADLPASVSLGADSTSVYLPGSGGDSTVLLTAFVADAGNQPVPDPATGDSAHNNVRFEVVGGAANGSLSGLSAVGGDVSGQVIDVRTTSGIANASFTAASAQGPVTIRATADAADNNVDNGIQEPISSTITLIISDGQLYNLEITSPLFAPGLPGLEINSLPVSGDVQGPVASGSIPANPDATLSLLVSVLATDRQGNPVVPGTAIRWGSVDEPVWPFDDPTLIASCEDGGDPYARGNSFKLSGCDGNPQEGGNLFTAPTGHFVTGGTAVPGDGAGPGDALVVFGEAVPGNADLESAVTVVSVNSQTSLTIAPDFTPNDTTGTSVDSGPVLPYLVGRSAHANITASSLTNALGVATAELTYTVNNIGHAGALWAQGNGDHRVTDAITLTYPAVAPGIIDADPNPIPGNTTTEVRVCLTGALGIPIRGAQIEFDLTLDGGGTGSVDGRGTSGTLAHRTGANGCAIAVVETSGVPASPADGSSGTLVFSAAGDSVDVGILVGLEFLQVTGRLCSADTSDGDDTSIIVTAIGTGGQPVPGVLITATCDSDITVTPGSATTDSDGSAAFDVSAPSGAPGGTCTFTADGAREASVAFSDDCFSP